MDDTYKRQVEAFIDDELTPDQERRMKETLPHFQELADYAYKIQKQKDLLKKWWTEDKKSLH